MKKNNLLFLLLLLVVIFLGGCQETKPKESVEETYQRLLASNVKHGRMTLEEAIANGYEYAEPEKPKFEITDIEFYKKSNSFIVEGKVKNLYDKNAYFVQVKANFKNENNEVIDTDYTYAVGKEGIGKDESSSFKIFIDYDKNIKYVSTEILDFTLE